MHVYVPRSYNGMISYKKKLFIEYLLLQIQGSRQSFSQQGPSITLFPVPKEKEKEKKKKRFNILALLAAPLSHCLFCPSPPPNTMLCDAQPFMPCPTANRRARLPNHLSKAHFFFHRAKVAKSVMPNKDEN
ncbi:uncharacterized protein GLRG_07810 [Colletotrichum graminicola M1.001]|uniref:Uncharacterized protein n=1 Tax=Colletotrichum graminicola (strain M1.001 / M2 / FGSC 10212) TaxID=645133 RepID=E3QP78_COLGM|nr:uncharacterized protein GLRG_07810 [Colletotrichum graminicola M1.001]EFQ32666.1 hypothetical protein GLRG_07810 [Colletotrichum graminicola M1.001]